MTWPLQFSLFSSPNPAGAIQAVLTEFRPRRVRRPGRRTEATEGLLRCDLGSLPQPPLCRPLPYLGLGSWRRWESAVSVPWDPRAGRLGPKVTVCVCSPAALLLLWPRQAARCSLPSQNQLLDGGWGSPSTPCEQARSSPGSWLLTALSSAPQGFLSCPPRMS